MELLRQLMPGKGQCKVDACLKTYCSDPNNESDPSSEYSPLGLTHVMNQYLGQKFTTWVKINCLNTILKPHNGIPRPCTVNE